MKKIVVLLSTIFITLIIVACNSSTSAYFSNVSGNWSGFASKKNNAALVPYTLSIEQNDTTLTGELNSSDTKLVALSGSIWGDSFKLSGSNGLDKYEVNGVKEDNQSVRIDIIKNSDTNHKITIPLNKKIKVESKFLSGWWKSFYVADMNATPIENAPSFSLLLNESDGNVSGTFSMDDNGTKVSFDLNGTILGRDINLTGSDVADRYEMRGILQDKDSLQMIIVKNYDINDFNKTLFYNVMLKKKSMQFGPTTNKISLEKKCGSSTNKVIILVHGFNSTAGIWDTLINNFKSKGICNRYSVWTFQYDWKKRIYQSAEDLKNHIHINEKIGNASPYFIAHSMGGLVVRKYIANYGKVSKLITLGTPHKGVSYNEMTSIYSGIGALLSDMAYDSYFITHLNNNSYEKSQRGKYLLLNGKVALLWHCTKSVNVFGHERCTWGYFSWSGNYSTQIQAGHLLIGKPNDGIVTQSSALFEGDNRVKRENPDKFDWVSHNQLPYAKIVDDYLSSLFR